MWQKRIKSDTVNTVVVSIATVLMAVAILGSGGCAAVERGRHLTALYSYYAPGHTYMCVGGNVRTCGWRLDPKYVGTSLDRRADNWRRINEG